MDGDDITPGSLLHNKIMKTGLKLTNNGTIAATSEVMDGDDTTLASLLHNKVMKRSLRRTNNDTIVAALPGRNRKEASVLLSEEERFVQPPEDELGSKFKPDGSDAIPHGIPESGVLLSV
ncbi:hypothetical protein NE237_005669 [Protea cynaroides]|uniref:Uncharacterized protein n=1 Tax=Protea cynaroides TaxID=273540 RepID=A0A9Q0QUQ1_9MAGN|nr:hypothetical protein NE237_005669 [Protea cynaroides]